VTHACRFLVEQMVIFVNETCMYNYRYIYNNIIINLCMYMYVFMHAVCFCCMWKDIPFKENEYKNGEVTTTVQ